MSKIEFNEIRYKEYGRCIQISNGNIDIVVTLDSGPRIIRFGFCGKQNEFCDDAKLTLSVGEDEWRLRGGHRLWCSPEVFPLTYWPDNVPIEFELTENGIKLREKLLPWVQVIKEMEVTLSENENKVKVVHRITNKNAWKIELAAWALSVMSPGGKEVIPQAQHQSHFSDGAKGSRTITLWSYTKMNDPRIYWGDRYITLKQDPEAKSNIKFGTSNEDGWAVYFNHNNLFIKRYKHNIDAEYPDKGVSYETFTADFMLEMESLSPLTTLEFNESIEHIEEWELIEGVAVPENDDKQIDFIVEKYINTTVNNEEE